MTYPTFCPAPLHLLRPHLHQNQLRQRRAHKPTLCQKPHRPDERTLPTPAAPRKNSDPQTTPHPQTLTETSTTSAPFSRPIHRNYTFNKKLLKYEITETKSAFKPPSPLSVFLPTAYPSSVAPGYSRWASLIFGRHLFRSAYYVLGTTSLLRSLGLGQGKALAVGAALQWVLKDGLGLATKLLVSARLAAVVDAHPRRWRILGDTLMALAAAVEISSVTKPQYFIVFGALAALLKEAASALSGPAYRVFLDSFAISSNIGELSSRGEAQIVVGNLAGLGLGALISTYLGSLDASDRFLPTLAFYAVLAAGHLTCTWNGVHTVQLRTLNCQRLQIILDRFLKDGIVPSVDDVNKRERTASQQRANQRRIRLGAPLLDFVQCGAIVSRASWRLDDRCIVAYNGREAGVIIREDAGPTDVLKGILQAEKLLVGVNDRGMDFDDNQTSRLTKNSYEWVQGAMPELLKGLEKQGWSTAKLLMDLGSSRYREGIDPDSN